MKKVMLAVVILISTFIACNKSKNDKVVASWRLKAYYQYEDSTSYWKAPFDQEVIQIFQSGDFICDGDICSLDGSKGLQVAGNMDYTDSSINSNNCKLYFSVNNDSMLVKYPDCDTLCMAIFTRI